MVLLGFCLLVLVVVLHHLRKIEGEPEPQEERDVELAKDPVVAALVERRNMLARTLPHCNTAEVTGHFLEQIRQVEEAIQRYRGGAS